MVQNHAQYATVTDIIIIIIIIMFLALLLSTCALFAADYKAGRPACIQNLNYYYFTINIIHEVIREP